MKDNFDSLIPHSCPQDIKNILEEYLSECSDLKEIKERLIKSPMSLQIWQLLDKHPKEEKREKTLDLLSLIAILYLDSVAIEKYSKNKKAIDQIKERHQALSKELYSIVDSISEFELVSSEEKIKLIESLNSFFFGIDIAINPADLSELHYGEEFKNAKSFKKKGQENAGQIFFTKMISKEFQKIFNQPLSFISFHIPYILRGEVPPSLTKKQMSDRARKNK